jgi:CRISPR/Cas system CMR-associated protein Cmr5 small subunit
VPKTSPPTTKSPAAPILALSQNPSKITRKGLREVSQQAALYLREQRDFISDMNKASEGPIREAHKLEEEITALNAKADKTEAQYQRLALVERMAIDFKSRAESAAKKVQTAEELLNDEIEEWAEPLVQMLNSDSNADLIARAAKAVTPFSGDRDPVQVAKTLPGVQFANGPTVRFRQGGHTIEALISIIEEEFKK